MHLSSVWCSEGDALQPCPQVHSPPPVPPPPPSLLYFYWTKKIHIFKTCINPELFFLHRNKLLFFTCSNSLLHIQGLTWWSTLVKWTRSLCWILNIHTQILVFSPSSAWKRTFLCTLTFAIFMSRAGDVPTAPQSDSSQDLAPGKRQSSNHTHTHTHTWTNTQGRK